MRTKRQRFWGVAVTLLLAMLAGGARTSAQETKPGPVPAGRRSHAEPRGGRSAEPGPQDATIRFVSSTMHYGSSTVKGRPYSAEAVTDNVQMLRDGTRLASRATARLYRDGEGRTRRDQEFRAIGPFVADEPMQMIFISDPVARADYRLDPHTRTAIRTPFGSGRPPADARPPASAARKIEPLGKRVIEGVEAEGMRSTITLPVGQVGNDRPLEIVSERWYSHELGIFVMSSHSDPRLGESTYQVTRLQREAPDPTLFRVPADYKIREGSFLPGPEYHAPAPARQPDGH